MHLIREESLALIIDEFDVLGVDAFLDLSLDSAGTHGCFHLRVHINAHTTNEHCTHFSLDNIKNTSTLSLSNLRSHLQGNLALFGWGNARFAFLSTLFFESLDLLFILSNLSLLDILRQYFIIELGGVLQGIIIVNFTTLWFHNITLFRISEVLEVVVLALTEVLLKHLFVLNGGVFLGNKALAGGIVARQVVVIVIIHNSEKLLVSGSISLTLSLSFFNHESIEFGLSFSCMLINFAASLFEMARDFNCLCLFHISRLAIGMSSDSRALSSNWLLFGSQINALILFMVLTVRSLGHFDGELLLLLGLVDEVISLGSSWWCHGLLFGLSCLFLHG